MAVRLSSRARAAWSVLKAGDFVTVDDLLADLAGVSIPFDDVHCGHEGIRDLVGVGLNPHSDLEVPGLVRVSRP